GDLLEDARPADLPAAIKAAATGQLHLSAQTSTDLRGATRLPERPKPLTDRELEVLPLLAQQHSKKESACTLRLVEEAVKCHVRHLLAKLGVQSRTQAVLAALGLRMVSTRS